MKKILANLMVKGFLFGIFISHINIASAANLTRGPYLQTGTSTSVIVRWRSDEATNSRVRIGTSPSNLTKIIDDAQSTTEHIVQVSGLTPNTKYFYAVGSTTERLSGGDANTYFSTAPETGAREPFRAWVIGDAGTGTEGQFAVYNAYRNFTGSTATNLWLQLGDNAYPDGTDANFQANVFNVYSDVLRQSVTWPAFGNHDGHSANAASQTGPYFDMFSLPKNGEAGGVASGTEAYYAFDYANVHFIVLDSTSNNRTVGTPMYKWLQADLQAAKNADWIIALWHHPPYTKGAHDSDTETDMTEMRKNFLPLLESYGVDLVLSGHSHSYERTYFINGHYDLSTTFDTATHVKQAGGGQVDKDGAYHKESSGLVNSGTVYVVAGASGKLKAGPLDHVAMFDSLYELGSFVLDVNGLTLDAKFINDTGVVRDYFTLTKGDNSSLGSISGLVWKDSNADGIRNTNELLLSDIEVQLLNSSNQVVRTMSTNGDGAYVFRNLAAGNYYVQVVKSTYAVTPINQGTNDTLDSDATTDGKISVYLKAGSSLKNIDIGLITSITSSTAASSSKSISSSQSSTASSKSISSIKSSLSTSSAQHSSSSKSTTASSSAPGQIVTVGLQEGLNGYTGASDTYVVSGQIATNYGDSVTISADGDDSTNGRLVALLKWLTTSIPKGKTVTAVSLQINVFDPTTAAYEVYAMNNSWAEGTATWSNTNPLNNKWSLLGSFTPLTTGVYTIPFNSAGVALVQSWINGNANNGLMILDDDNVNGIDIRSSERATISSRPKLVITYQ